MNLVLFTKIRPTVLFNPQLKDHRFWAHKFLKERSWTGCPFVFALPQSEPNVYTMITRELATYYLEREFQLKPRAQGVVKMQQKFALKTG